MKDKTHPEFRLDSFNLVNFILEHWKLFLVTGIIAFLVSAAISLLIRPRYSSEVVLYPSASVEEAGSRVFSDQSAETVFGDEEAVEKILQILQSDDIRTWLVEKYDLFSHYGIDNNTRYRYTHLNNKMDRNIRFGKTMYMSVRITVTDEDPVIAADMANDIASMIDSTFNRLVRNAGNKYLTVLERQYKEQELLINQFEDSLETLGKKLGISGSHTISGNASRIDNMADYGPDYVRLAENHEQAVEDLGLIRQKLTEARISAGEDFPYTLIVNKARVSERKSFPRRTYIVVISTLSTLLFVLLIMIIFEGLSFGKEPGR